MNLEYQAIYNEMAKELDKKSIRYQKEILEHYVSMKIPLTKNGITPQKPYKWHKENKTSIEKSTLRNWIRIFIDKYT